VQLQVVERVFVRLEAEVLDEMRATLAFIVARAPLGLAILPLRRVGDLLEARQQHCVEVVGHLDEDEPAPSAVFAVEVDDGVAGRTGTGESIEKRPPLHHSDLETPLYQRWRLRKIEDGLAEHVADDLLAAFIVDEGVDP